MGRNNPSLLPIRGRALYRWPEGGIEEDLIFRGPDQLGAEPHDVLIVGAGVVGCALAYRLSRYQLRILVVDGNFDVGEGTSKANSAIVHTGFDAAPGSLESRLVTSASRRWPEMARKLKIPIDPIGALLMAIGEEQGAQLHKIHEKALANGVDDVELKTTDEIRGMQPRAPRDLKGGMLVPRESLGDPFTTSIAYAELALANGVDFVFGVTIQSVDDADQPVKKVRADGGGGFAARRVVNAAGLGGRRLADTYQGAAFDINPRRGQFLLFDKSSRPAVNHILLPVPTPQTKGVLVTPTIYGNLLAGPTAEDLPLGCETATDTTAEGIAKVMAGAAKMYPDLVHQPVIGTYAGARCNCAQGSYLIHHHDGGRGMVTVTGVRSTGFTASFRLADHLIEIMAEHCDLELVPDADALDERPESSWPGWWRRPYDDPDRIASNPDYGRQVCFCEVISRGEVIGALDSPLRPRTLDGVKRRTRALMGRCQGFDCAVPMAELVADHCGLAIERITKRGPGSELIAPAGAGGI